MMHSPLTHGELESSLNPPEKSSKISSLYSQTCGSDCFHWKKKKAHSLQQEKITGEFKKNSLWCRLFSSDYHVQGATHALINVSWLGKVHGMTNTLTDAAGVGNTAGQRTRSIAEVVLVYFPILVLISSTTRKLKKTKWDCDKKKPKMGIVIIICVMLSS